MMAPPTVPSSASMVIAPACAPASAATTACPAGGAAAAKVEVPAAAAPVKGPKRARAGSKAPSPGAEASPEAPGGPPDGSDDGKTPESGNWLIVAKAVRSHLKNSEVPMHCGSDALPALNVKLADMIKEAIGRAQSNGRKTLKACDF